MILSLALHSGYHSLRQYFSTTANADISFGEPTHFFHPYVAVFKTSSVGLNRKYVRVKYENESQVIKTGKTMTVQNPQ
jgi:hypothetical protein